MTNIKQQRRQIYAEFDRLNARSNRGEDVTAELLQAGERLDNLGKHKHRVDVMDMDRLITKAKAAELKKAARLKRQEDELAIKMDRTERKKWIAIAERNGIRYKTFSARVLKGMNYKDAATIPTNHVNRNPWIDVAEKNGIGLSTFHNRRKVGFTDEEAATIPVNMQRKSYHEMAGTK